MKNLQPPAPETIRGDLKFPSTWQVVAPFESAREEIPRAWLESIPEELTIGGITKQRTEVTPTRQQFDFTPYFGNPPYDYSQMALVYIPLESPGEQEVHLGFGGDWYLQAWLNGEEILNLMVDGTEIGPPAIYHYTELVKLKAGRNLLVVRFVHGNGGGQLAVGGPAELRSGDFKSIIPVKEPLNGTNIYERYPTDPAAPVRWEVPAGFDPGKPDLGLPELKEANHRIVYRAKKGDSPLDEGGSGIYDGLNDGTWNHNIGSFQFQDRVLVIWDNHALDENGPGSRTLAKVGKILNEQGDVDWDGPGSLVELTPQPVPVRRRKLHSDEDRIRGAQSKGRFIVHGERLFLVGGLTALHGVHNVPDGQPNPIPDENYFWGKGPECPGATFARIDLKFRFIQEWGVKDDVFQPLSPLYCENRLPDKIAITPSLSLPAEPLLPPFADAPFIVDADDVLQQAFQRAADLQSGYPSRYAPGTLALASDGKYALAHGTQYTRKDGSMVAIREYLRPRQEPVFWAAEKGADEAYFPPAKRTNLFGAVNPDAGSFPDGSNYLVLGSPNRRTMYLTVSADGRTFDRSWFLLHMMLSDYTPGEMKKEGGPGAGPQYFVSQVVGNKIWIGYSISKEHIGITEVPISALS